MYQTPSKEMTSEREHEFEVNHFMTKFKREEHFTMTADEKSKLLSAIRNYPNKNHSPICEF